MSHIPTRRYGFTDEADPPREPMTTGDKVVFVLACIASGLVVAWGLVVAISKFTGA